MGPVLAGQLREIFGKNTRLVPRHVPLRPTKTKNTSIERSFEAALKRSPLAGKYVKQHDGVSPFFMDFAFVDVRLCVEADGEHWHKNTEKKDDFRDKVMRAYGWAILRFWGNDLLKYPDECVIETIRAYRALGGNL